MSSPVWGCAPILLFDTLCVDQNASRVLFSQMSASCPANSSGCGTASIMLPLQESTRKYLFLAGRLQLLRKLITC